MREAAPTAKSGTTAKIARAVGSAIVVAAVGACAEPPYNAASEWVHPSSSWGMDQPHGLPSLETTGGIPGSPLLPSTQSAPNVDAAPTPPATPSGFPSPVPSATASAPFPQDGSGGTTAVPPADASGGFVGAGATPPLTPVDVPPGPSTAPTPGGSGGARPADPPGGEPPQGTTNLDVFGITQLYPSAATGAEWTSQHWSTAAYALSERTDPNDPQGLSGMRGTGTLEIEGGELVFGGSQPRIYIYPGSSGPWRDVEITVYYQRVSDAATAWAGLVIGARSGPEGHGTDNCDAHTYYSRVRHDGAIDFEKELMHSPSSTKNSIPSEQAWPPDGQLPFNVWIGWKFVIYNLPEPNSVKLEAYRDMTDGAAGGDWQLVNEAVDNGGWFTQTSCAEHAPVSGESDMVVTEGGVTFIRNTDVTEARYKKLTVREIAPR